MQKNLNDYTEEFIPCYPERHLLAAILERALVDVCSTDIVERKKALSWIYAESENGEEPYEFSFKWIVKELGWDEDRIRRIVKKGYFKRPG